MATELNTEEQVARTCAQNGKEKDSQEGLKIESSRQKDTGKAKNDPEKNLLGTLKKDGTDMGNGRKRSKRETFMEKKKQLHYPKWIDAIKEEEERIGN